MMGHGMAGCACAVPTVPNPTKAAVMAPPSIAPPTARRATVPRAEAARCLPAEVVADIFLPFYKDGPGDPVTPTPATSVRDAGGQVAEPQTFALVVS